MTIYTLRSIKKRQTNTSVWKNKKDPRYINKPYLKNGCPETQI